MSSGSSEPNPPPSVTWVVTSTTGVEYGDVIYAIAESPIAPGLIWVGTNDGLVQITREAGAFLKGQLTLVRTEYAALLEHDLTALNDLLKKRGLAPILTTQP